MAHPVKLTDIIEGIDFQSEEGRSYLNTATGEVVYITDEEVRAAEADAPLEDYLPWQQDAIRIAKDMLRPMTTSRYRAGLTSTNTVSWSVSAWW
jgi:phosphoribosyl 1,2-cyclic phosphodiesterase